MKNIKTLALIAIVALASSVSASTLFWQVSADSSAGGYSGTIGEGGAVYAALYAADAKYNGEYTTSGTELDFYSLTEGTTKFQTVIDETSYSASVFYVELLNASGEVLHTQTGVLYNDLVSNGYVSTTALSVPQGALSGGFNGASVPEPTSALLFLMGASLLALRRRRA